MGGGLTYRLKIVALNVMLMLEISTHFLGFRYLAIKLAALHRAKRLNCSTVGSRLQ